MININLQGYFITNEEHKKYIKALEKQTPKNVISFGCDNHESWGCPYCETIYLDWSICDYCPECGQKLIWSKAGGTNGNEQKEDSRVHKRKK